MPRLYHLPLTLWFFTAPQSAQPGPEPNLRGFFEEITAGAPAVLAGQVLHSQSELADLYAGRNHAPIWTAGGPLAGQTRALLTAIRQSQAHGLDRHNYHEAALTQAIENSLMPNLAFELLLSDAFLSQARDRSSGAVSPQELDPEWLLVAPQADILAALRKAMEPDAGVLETLDNLWPKHQEYWALVEKRAWLLAEDAAELQPIAGGPLLKPGKADERVLALKQRLLGPGEYNEDYDEELKSAVVDFQRAAGLESDAIVGPATLEELNATSASRVDQIDANLERWRWLPQEMPETYIRVNIAGFALRVIQNGQDVLTMDAIVGRPYRRTPIFSESIKYLVFNPYWNVPFKLAVEDKLPILKKDPAQLDALGYEVRPSGQEDFTALSTVNWSGVTRGTFRYLLRQRPGPHNALGRVKFMLPNPHDVYLHDTPERALFAKQERSFSSGCVRLSDALGLARWVLNNDGRPGDAERVSELAAGEQTSTIYLNHPVPVYLVYFTAFTDSSGEVVFRRDPYQRDPAIVAALRANATQ